MAEPAKAEATPAEPSLPAATDRFAAHVGVEASQRPSPVVARALGGFAALLAGGAVAALGLDVVLDGGSRIAVALMFVPYAGAGLALLLLGSPSQRTAGVTALTVAIPAGLGFVILERGGYAASDLTAVLAASAVAWGALHVAGPARGHGILLGAALAGAWATVLTGLDVLALFDPPRAGAAPDVVAPAVASLAFGVVYVVVGSGLDLAGLRGTATGFLGAGIAALAAGIALASVEGTDALVGALMLGAGGLVGWIGSRAGRRVPIWAGSAAVVTGLGVVAASPFGAADLTAPAVAVLVVSGAVVALVPGISRVLREPRETPKP